MSDVTSILQVCFDISCYPSFVFTAEDGEIVTFVYINELIFFLRLKTLNWRKELV